MCVLKLYTFPSRLMAEITRNRNGHTRRVKCSHFGIFSIINRPYLFSQTIPYNIKSTVPRVTWHRATQRVTLSWINIYVSENCSFVFLEMWAWDASAQTPWLQVQQQPLETSPQRPGVVRLHVNAFYFSTTARRVTSLTWGLPPPCKQALSGGMNQVFRPRVPIWSKHTCWAIVLVIR